MAQRANYLAIVVVHRDYHDVLLSDQHLTDFRLEYRKEVDRLLYTSWPIFDSTFIKGGAVHFVSTNVAAKEWLLTRILTMELSSGGQC